MKAQGRLTFRPGFPDFTSRQSAVIDFREELSGSAAREFPITGILWISEDPALDMALLRVARTASRERIGPPIVLASTATIDPSRMLAVVGYPGSGVGYDPERFRRLFGPVLGKKRFSPGLFDGLRNGFMTIDSSTLPGSSGSVVLDVETGTALGLHFAGTASRPTTPSPRRPSAASWRNSPGGPKPRRCGRRCRPVTEPPPSRVRSGAALDWASPDPRVRCAWWSLSRSPCGWVGRVGTSRRLFRAAGGPVETTPAPPPIGSAPPGR